MFIVKNLKFYYRLGKEKIEAIRGVNLEIQEGAMLAIMGPSGSGKSTLLNLLGLIEPMQEGSIEFFKNDFGSLSEKEKNQIRKFEIGFIFQHFHLFPVLSAEENVKYFLANQKLSAKEIQKRSEEALKAVGLWEFRKQKPSELSGGQKQRVAIARAIAKKPKVIIADEPTASLDQKTGREIMEILKQYVEEQKGTVILTTHDPMVKAFANQHLHLVDGAIDGGENVVFS